MVVTEVARAQEAGEEIAGVVPKAGVEEAKAGVAMEVARWVAKTLGKGARWEVAKWEVARVVAAVASRSNFAHSSKQELAPREPVAPSLTELMSCSAEESESHL